MIMLWCLQILFLNTYYEEMKKQETQDLAASVVARYGQEGMLNDLRELNRKNDMYIQIEAYIEDASLTVYTSYDDAAGNSESAAEASLVPFSIYRNEIREIRGQLLNGWSPFVNANISNPMRDSDMMAYCTCLERDEGRQVLLYIFSPLYPVESTVAILADQLKYVTVISLLLSFLLSFYISRMVTKPLTNITNSAARLGEGDYAARFEGGSYSEINRLADTLTYTADELSKARDMQKDLIANVSHDLRTPLTMVKSYAEMVRDLSGDNPKKRNEHLQVIIDEADRLSLLVSDLLELSKMQSGKQALSITAFSLRETIESVLNSYRVFAEQEGFSLSFTHSGEGLIVGDEGKIKQVLLNLLANAIKYSAGDRRIEVDLYDDGEATHCSVRDHGVGIPKRELKHIWKRYYKASGNYLRPPTGTGLGLSIVKEILDLHDARYGVDSEVGKGSVFWFEIKL
jgi:signal transduction histidine kinase